MLDHHVNGIKYKLKTAVQYSCKIMGFYPRQAFLLYEFDSWLLVRWGLIVKEKDIARKQPSANRFLHQSCLRCILRSFRNEFVTSLDKDDSINTIVSPFLPSPSGLYAAIE